LGGQDLTVEIRRRRQTCVCLTFTIELLNAGEIEPGLVAHHWVVRDTNTGPGADGSAPTGRAISFKGASIIQVEGDKIRSDTAYFDRKALD